MRSSFVLQSKHLPPLFSSSVDEYAARCTQQFSTYKLFFERNERTRVMSGEEVGGGGLWLWEM